MPARRKRFDCGHFGWGTFCHRCAQAKTLDKEIAKLEAKHTSPKDSKTKKHITLLRRMKFLRTEAKRLRGPAS